METKKEKIWKIIILIIGIICVAVLGSIFVNLGMEWFNSLARPSQWIPNIVIPIMWTIIYIVYGIVFSLWITKNNIPKETIVWLIINGILNVLWCLVFFTLKQTFLGNIVIVLNLIAAIVLWTNIYKHSIIYSIFTVIYPIWLCLATTLNTALWILN